jgi:hypothetical protein
MVVVFVVVMVVGDREELELSIVVTEMCEPEERAC